ncbi:MAG: DUF624 domain-containing protein [Clostridia bacterium]|nr:DUF624 domain-containing protein [Clostridia bacterium]
MKKKYPNMSRSSHDNYSDEMPKKKKRKNLFDLLYSRDGKEITEDDRNAPRNFTFFFKLTGRNLTRLFYVNVLFIIANFPLIIMMLFPAKIFHLHAVSPSSPMFLPLYGAYEFGAVSPSLSTLWGLFGNPAVVDIPTPLAWTVLIVGALLLLFTFGPVSIGTSYILRNIVRGEPIFFMRDFWYAIKKNLRQGIIIGILDLLICFLLVYDLVFFYNSPASFLNSFMMWATVFMILIYFVMRFYIYILTLTFDLKIRHIFKNALIFSFLGFKRNFVAAVGIILTVFINFYIAMIFVPIGVVLPLIITIGLCMFMSAYAAWPKIKEIMIDPYEQPSDEDPDDDGEENADTDEDDVSDATADAE